MFKPYNKAEISFTLTSEIGQEGSNSTAYLAHDDQLDAEIVIKKILKSDLDSVDEFFDEAKILYLSSHSNVVPVYYACQDADSIYVAMPYYKRGSLNALLKSRYLSVREIVIMGCQIASGLHNIHSKGLVHFDIKPDNVLLSDRGEALIADFGLSRRMNAAGVAGQDRLYFKMRPPEAYSQSEFGPAFDIYQLGLTLYCMCNGNASFYEQFHMFGAATATFDRDGFKFAVCNGRFPDRSRFLEHIPDRLRQVIRECLKPEPADRVKAALDVANTLAQVEDRLDWRYETTGTARVWTRPEDGRTYRLTVESDGRSVADKTMASGSCTRISGYCKTTITPQEIRRFLKEV